jgi:hypothetical protein
MKLAKYNTTIHFFIFLSYAIIPSYQKSFLKEVSQFKHSDDYIFKSLVKIISSPSIPLLDESLYRDIESLGFFISEEIILANKKSVPKTSQIMITLFDNTTLAAGVTYEDPFLPFCLLKINSNDKSYKRRVNSLSIKKSLSLNLKDLYEISIQNKSIMKLPLNVTKLDDNFPIRYENLIKVKFCFIKIQNHSSPILGNLIVNSQNEGNSIQILFSDCCKDT